MKPYDNDAEKKVQVQAMFDAIAPRYDLLNHLLSLNIDRAWRKKLIRRLDKPTAVLDLAAGTGDLSLMVARAFPEASVTGGDISPNMLAVARAKAAKRNLDITFTVVDAENLPFPNEQFDALTCAFGVRNFQELTKGVAEAFRVLKPGGILLILEFSTPKRSILATLYKFYFKHLLPRVGGLISGDKKAYEYLPKSVETFPSSEKFVYLLNQIGFTEASYTPLTGGVATIYQAIKQ